MQNIRSFIWDFHHCTTHQHSQLYIYELITPCLLLVVKRVSVQANYKTKRSILFEGIDPIVPTKLRSRINKLDFSED